MKLFKFWVCMIFLALLLCFISTCIKRQEVMDEQDRIDNHSEITPQTLNE